MNTLLKKILLHLSSQTGVIIMSIASFLTVMFRFGYFGIFMIEMIAALISIRIGYNLTRGPRPVLTKFFVRKHFKKVFNEEVRISIGFFAVCYLMNWPASKISILIFLTVNFAAQTGILYLSKWMRNILINRICSDDKSGCGKQVIIVGTGRKGKSVSDMILRSPELDTSIIGFLDYHRKGLWRYRDIPLLGHTDLLPGIVSTCQVDALIIAIEPEDIPLARSLFETAEKMGVTICMVPDVFETGLTRPRPGYINGTAVVVFRAIPEGQFAYATKAVIDKIAAVAGLILTLPLTIITAIAIKLESKGPVFFKQTRSGLHGKPFELYKFRTMCDDAEKLKKKLLNKNEMSGPVFKIKDDPRVTRIGKVLRKFSIDEIPQFINIFKGEMSLVGPRPPLPREVEHYEPWQHRKLSVKPGATCTWQTNGRNNIDFEDWMRLDLKYIDNWSLWEDTKIIAKTIPAVMKTRGAS